LDEAADSAVEDLEEDLGDSVVADREEVVAERGGRYGRWSLVAGHWSLVAGHEAHVNSSTP
jgi:hypothetical protein